VIPGAGVASAASGADRTAAATKVVLSTAGQLGAAAQKAATSSTTTTSTTSTTTTSATAASKVKKAKKKPAVPLTGWLTGAASFPNRAVVLDPPTTAPLTLGALHVSENGAPVGTATLTPIAQAGKNDFGVMLAVDQNTAMAGTPLAAAMSAVRSFASQRTAQQQLGLITFDQTPNVLLHPTSNPRAIYGLFAASPWTGAGADVPAATKLALSELATAKVALGAVIVISDGAGISSQGPSPSSVQQEAAAARVPVFTVGLEDAHSSAAALNALKAASPGQFVASTAANLATVLKQIDQTLNRGYILRYRSVQPNGHPVSLTVSAAGIPGTVQASYQAPAAKATPPPAKQSPTPAPRHRGPDFSHTTLLSPRPAFAPAVAPPAAPANTSFWGSSGSIPIIAGIAGLLMVISIMLLFYRPSKRAVRVRVGSFIPSADGEIVDDLHIKARPKGNIFERARWWGPFAQEVEISRSAHTPGALIKRGAIGGAVVAVLAFLISGSILIALLPLVLWPFVVRTMVKRGARKQRELFADTLPGYLQDLASAMRVGRSFANALGVVAGSADEPVRSELERAVTDEALGRPLEESIEAVAVRMQASDMDQVALIASLNRRSGSNVAEALDRVADGARDRADLRREIKALTAQAKMSSWVLTGLPPLLLVAISLVSPQYAHPLLHTTIGIILVIVGGLMVFGGWKVMKKITTIKA
jgi:tight adherence protein B